MNVLVRTKISLTRCGFLLISIFCMFLAVSAQIPNSMSDATNTEWNKGSGERPNTLAGTVFLPSGEPVNVRMNVRLNSMLKGESRAVTDDRGKFIFSGIPAGEYYLVIEGDRDFEPVSQLVEITYWRGNTPPPPYNVAIRLRDKINSQKKPGVIDLGVMGAMKKASDHYNKALELSRTGDNKGALEQLKLSVEADPGFMLAYNETGVQHLKLNELEKADEALKIALKLKPEAFEPLMNRGIVLFRLKSYSDAEAHLRNALKAKDQSALAHFYLGRTLAKLSGYDEAEMELNASISIGGTEMNEAHRMLAMMYIDKDDRPKAVSSLETYLRLVPNAPDAAKLRDAIKQLKGQ